MNIKHGGMQYTSQDNTCLTVCCYKHYNISSKPNRFGHLRHVTYNNAVVKKEATSLFLSIWWFMTFEQRDTTVAELKVSEQLIIF